MITLPISAYRSYSDGNKIVKEPLVKVAEDHLLPNAQVRVLCLSSDTIATIFLFSTLALKSHLILGISELRKFRNYVNAPVIGNDM